MISDTATLHLQPVLLNLAQKMDNLSQYFGQKRAKIGHFYSVLEAKFSKISQLNTLFEMNFECFEASTGELRVSENSAASNKHAGWVCLTPYLTLKKHVSKHTQLRSVITQRYYATP